MPSDVANTRRIDVAVWLDDDGAVTSWRVTGHDPSVYTWDPPASLVLPALAHVSSKLQTATDLPEVCSNCGLDGSSFTMAVNLAGCAQSESRVVCSTCLVLVALTELKEVIGAPSLHAALDYCIEADNN